MIHDKSSIVKAAVKKVDAGLKAKLSDKETSIQKRLAELASQKKYGSNEYESLRSELISIQLKIRDLH